MSAPPTVHVFGGRRPAGEGAPSLRTPRAALAAAVAGLLAVAAFGAAIAAPPLAHDFGINNGLGNAPAGVPAVPGSTPPDYHADLPDPTAPGGVRRFELHWLPVPGKTYTRAALWEPAAQCLTPLRDAARITADNWTFNVDEAEALTPNGDCRPGRRFGGLAGVGSVHVLLEARGEQLSHHVGIAVRADPGVALPPMLQGPLVPAPAIAARRDVGRFQEKFLYTEGFASLEGIWLATTYGLFRGTDRAPRTGGPGFVVVETTDLYRAFAPGELFIKVQRDGSNPLRLRLVQQSRVGDGSHCPDRDDDRGAFDLRLVSLRNGARTWSAQPVARAAPQRHCVAEEISRRSCKVVGCLQWSDTVSDALFDRIDIFTDHEAHARKLYVSLPQLTLAGSGIARDPLTWRGRTGRGGADPTARCGGIGQEDCAAQRRREDIEQFLIQQW